MLNLSDPSFCGFHHSSDNVLYKSGFSIPSWTVQFGMYRTTPARNRHGSVVKNGLDLRIIQKASYRIKTA